MILGMLRCQDVLAEKVQELNDEIGDHNIQVTVFESIYNICPENMFLLESALDIWLWAKLRMSVINKDIVQMYLGYNLFFPKNCGNQQAMAYSYGHPSQLLWYIQCVILSIFSYCSIVLLMWSV